MIEICYFRDGASLVNTSKETPVKMLDLTGQRFGRLQVVCRDGKVGTHISWKCKCDCGGEKTINGASLRYGRSMSCGCYNAELIRKRNEEQVKEKEVVCRYCGKKFTAKYFIEKNCIKSCSKECLRLFNLERIHLKSRESFETYIHKKINITRNNAKGRKLPFDLDYAFVYDLFLKQDKRCARTRIPFELPTGRGANGKSPWAISFDQINPKGGYTKGNVQLVCMSYNLAKHTWSDAVVYALAKALMESSSKKEEEATQKQEEITKVEEYEQIS